MNRKLAITAVAALATLLTACGTDDTATEPALPAPIVEQPDEDPAADPDEINVLDFLSHDDEKDGMDCEADDKAKKEVPDCGFYVGTGASRTFYWWSWVQAGKTKPPAEWKVATEVQVRRAPAPAAKPAKPASPAAKPATGRTTQPTATPTRTRTRKP